MNDIKIIFLARRFPPSVGGMERFAYDLSNSLEDKVELKKITWGGSSKLLPLILPWFFLQSLVYIMLHPNIRLIHIQDAVQAPIGWLLRLVTRRPYIVVAHGLDITFPKFKYQKLIIPFVRRADYVIAISDATRRQTELRGIKKTKLRTITLGVYDDYDNPESDRKMLSKNLNLSLSNKIIILTTGRLVKRKGVAWFVEKVLPILTKKYPNLYYLIAGDGEERDNIIKATEARNMHGHVKLLGRVTDETRSLLYQTCDIFVMPNIKVRGDMEGFGIVAHEAATAAVPVVASRLEGIRDAIHDQENGILLTPHDKRAFVETIDNLLANPKQSKKFGRQAREYTLDHFSWPTIANKYVEVYKEVIK